MKQGVAIHIRILMGQLRTSMNDYGNTNDEAINIAIAIMIFIRITRYVDGRDCHDGGDGCGDRENDDGDDDGNVDDDVDDDNDVYDDGGCGDFEGVDDANGCDEFTYI